jgi:hypothetical protein
VPGKIIWAARMLSETVAFATYFYLPSDVRPLAFLALLLCLLAHAGVWWFLRSHATHAALLLGPILAAMVAAVARVLPLSGRVALWLGPLLLLLAAGGVSLVGTVGAKAGPWLQRGVTGVFAATCILALLSEPPPYRSQDLRPVLEKVASQAQPSDAIYVYYGARLSMRFYGPRVGLTNWTEGNCHRSDPVAYFRELDVFRGRDRVWVIWTHALERYGEPKIIRSYLSAIGAERVRINAFEGEDTQDAAQALLYDLSDPEKLKATTAERHTIPPPDHPHAGRTVPCGGPANDATTAR